MAFPLRQYPAPMILITSARNVNLTVNIPPPTSPKQK